MRRMLTAIFLLSFAVLPAMSQDWTPTGESEEIFRAFNDAARKHKSVDCLFTEEKYVYELNEKTVRRGRFSFHAPDTVSIEMLSGKAFSVSIGGGEMTVVSGKKEYSVNLASNKQYKKMMAMLADGGLSEIKMPAMSAWEKPGYYMLETDIRQMGFTGRVTVVIRSSDMALESFRISDGEDYTLLTVTEYSFDGRQSLGNGKK